MKRLKTDKTAYEREDKEIILENGEKISYWVTYGNGHNWEVNNEYTLHFRYEEKPAWGRELYEQSFSLGDMKLLAYFVKSKAQFPTPRFHYDKLIEYYIARGYLNKNDAVIPVIKCFFDAFIDLHYVDNTTEFIEKEWDRPLENYVNEED